MPARERGGDASGGGNARISFLLRQAGEDDKGLLLSAESIDETGHLRGESKGEADPAIGGHVDLPIFAGPGVDRHGALRLQFPADVSGFAGADSNNITVRLFRNDSFVRSPSVTWVAASGLLTIILSGTVPVSAIRDAIDNLSDITIENSLTGAATGSDSLVVPASNAGRTDRNLQGGRDEIPPGIDLLAQPEDEVNGPNILVKYDPADETTLQALLDELEENDQGVTIVVPYGTDLTAAPEAVPFVRGYQGNVAEAPSTGTGGLTQGQVDARIRALNKGYALKGGPDVPASEVDPAIARDSEIKPYARVGGGDVDEGDIPDAITRDTEVPGLLADALTDHPLSQARSDTIPYQGSGGDWRRASTETFRELFASYVGTWPVANGFIFRKGDLTDHDGRVYFVNTEHVVNTGNGPETNAHYTPLDNWVGTITQTWYRAGSMGLYDGGLWGAIRDVVNTDALPGINHPKWLLLSADERAILDGGVFSVGATYKKNRIVRKSDAAYLTLQDGVTGIDPGTTSGWESRFFRLGWVNGAPDSLVGAPTVDAGTGELITQTRGGHENRTPLPSGGTTVAANPAGTTGDELTRLAIAGINYNLPNPTIPDIGRTEQVAFQNRDNFTTGSAAEVTPAAVDPISVVSGDGDPSLLSGVTGNDFTVKAGLYIVEAVFEARADGGDGTCKLLYRNADDDSLIRSTSSSYLGRSSEGWQDLTKVVVISLAQDTAINVAGRGIRAGFDLRNLTVSFTELSGSARADSTVTPSPSISSFTLRSGDQTPVAGSIAAQLYGVDWAIANSDHVGLARIIGFKGEFGDGTGAVVLNTIPAGNYAHGSGNVVIPNGVSLDADETYRLRIQVFDEGTTSAAIGATPETSQDIVITAHAAATALYHSGRVPYDSNDADAAATVARIVFATHDTQTWGALPSEFTLALPNDGADYQAYFAAASSAAQPAGFTLSGQPATQGFTEVTATKGGVEYKIWVQKPNYRVTHDTENGNTYGVTP